jgi:hypothetical protein
MGCSPYFVLLAGSKRFARGTLSHDVFWEEPKLVAAFRTLEKENRPEEAANVFN